MWAKHWTIHSYHLYIYWSHGKKFCLPYILHLPSSSGLKCIFGLFGHTSQISQTGQIDQIGLLGLLGIIGLVGLICLYGLICLFNAYSWSKYSGKALSQKGAVGSREGSLPPLHKHSLALTGGLGVGSWSLLIT